MNKYVKVRADIDKATQQKIKTIIRRYKYEQDQVVNEISAIILNNMDDSGVIVLSPNLVAEIKESVKTNLDSMVDYQIDQLTYGADDNGKFEKRIETPKSDAGYRTIPIFPEVKTILLEEWQRQKKSGIRCLDTISGAKVIDKDNHTVECTLTDFVFLNRFGNCLLPHSTNKAFERIRNSYNEYERQLAEQEHREPQEIAHFSNHYLRHTACTRLCEGTNDIAVIKSVMGHSDIQTTMNIYNEVHDQHKQDVFTALAGKMKIG